MVRSGIYAVAFAAVVTVYVVLALSLEISHGSPVQVVKVKWTVHPDYWRDYYVD